MSMSGSIGSLSNAAASGVSGVRQAANLQASAAGRVSEAFRMPSGGGGSGAAATVELSSVSQDLAGAFTDMTKADGMNKANVAVIRTTDGMMKDLMDIVG